MIEKSSLGSPKLTFFKNVASPHGVSFLPKNKCRHSYPHGTRNFHRTTLRPLRGHLRVRHPLLVFVHGHGEIAHGIRAVHVQGYAQVLGAKRWATPNTTYFFIRLPWPNFKHFRRFFLGRGGGSTSRLSQSIMTRCYLGIRPERMPYFDEQCWGLMNACWYGPLFFSRLLRTSPYFSVLLCTSPSTSPSTSPYFSVLLRTSPYFSVLLLTSLYFSVLLCTSRVFGPG